MISYIGGPRMEPACAVAKFVQVGPGVEDVTRAEGPASSTTAGEQDREADDGASNSVPWMSVIEDNMAKSSKLSQLPALQTLLDKLETRQSAWCRMS